jgi:hypothetical protein
VVDTLVNIAEAARRSLKPGGVGIIDVSGPIGLRLKEAPIDLKLRDNRREVEPRGARHWLLSLSPQAGGIHSLSDQAANGRLHQGTVLRIGDAKPFFIRGQDLDACPTLLDQLTDYLGKKVLRLEKVIVVIP